MQVKHSAASLILQPIRYPGFKLEKALKKLKLKYFQSKNNGKKFLK